MTKIKNSLLENYRQMPGLGGVLQLLVHGKLLTEFSVGTTPLVIGRSPDSDVVLPDSAISRRHAKVSVENGAILVKDLGSAHGIVIGGQAVPEGIVQSNGEFSILQYQFRYVSNSDITMKQKSQDNDAAISDRVAVSKQEHVLGFVGLLQFDVLMYRLRDEYGVDPRLENLKFSVARWPKDKDGNAYTGPINTSAKILMDRNDHPVVLLEREWDLKWLQEKNPDISFQITD